jgi:hypothetical protein
MAGGSPTVPRRRTGGGRSSTFEQHVAVFELSVALEAEPGDQPVELRLEIRPEPCRSEVESVGARHRRVDERAIGSDGQDAASEGLARLEQHHVAHALLLQQRRRQQPADAAADDGDPCVGDAQASAAARWPVLR